MGEKEDKEKAEKLAAAKKRVAALQKKKKAAGAGVEKSGTKSKDKSVKEETPKSPTKADPADEQEQEQGGIQTETKHTAEDDKLFDQSDDVDDDENAFNEAIMSATQPHETSPSPDDQDDSLPSSKTRHLARQQSISLQSKLRSTSFRTTAPGPISPSVSSIQRIEELEFENKRLAEEAAELQSRWQQTEEELEELRLGSTTKNTSEINSLKAEIESLKRSQRQNSASSKESNARRESSSTSISPEHSSLLKDLESKDSTIADMQLEISRLRSEISSQTAGCSTHGSQITSLSTALSTTESRLTSLQNELTTTKAFLSRASAKSLLDTTERTSKDHAIRNLESSLAALTTERDTLTQKVTQATSKIDAMNKLHRETESRSASKLSNLETTAREIPSLRAKLTTLEADNARLREKHKRNMSGADTSADADVDELEDEGRKKLEHRVRELEGEVFDLRRGVWRDKRAAMQPDLTEGGTGRSSFELQQAADGEGFDDVDLSGGAGGGVSGYNGSRRASSLATRTNTRSPLQQKHSNFTQYISSGLSTFLPSTTSPPPPQSATTRARNDSLLEDFDDDTAGFDENAFAAAQREEEAKKMVEHVREVKRGLVKWKGWRLDLVDARKGQADAWEVFEV